MKKLIQAVSVLCMLGFSTLLCACGTSVYMSYRDSDYEILEGEATSLENIDEIEIHWARGDINIVANDGDALIISEVAARKNTPPEDELARYRIADGKLTIQFCAPKVMISHLEKELTISLPKSLAEALSELSVESATGAVNIVAVTADTIDIDAASGSVSMQLVSARDIDLDLASTSLSFDSVTASRRIKIDCASANLRMTDTTTDLLKLQAASCDIDYEGSLSSLELDATSINAQISLPNGALSELDGDFANGNITLCLPETFDGFEAEISGLSTSFSSEFATEKRGGEYVYGNGRAEISVSSVSGKVDIRKIQK